MGAREPSQYLSVLKSDRVTRGEVFGAGRHYAGLVAAWQASDLLSVQATALANLQDPSVMLVPALEYWMEQSVLLRAGGYVPIALETLLAASLQRRRSPTARAHLARACRGRPPPARSRPPV